MNPERENHQPHSISLLKEEISQVRGAISTREANLTHLEDEIGKLRNILADAYDHSVVSIEIETLKKGVIKSEGRISRVRRGIYLKLALMAALLVFLEFTFVQDPGITGSMSFFASSLNSFLILFGVLFARNSLIFLEVISLLPGTISTSLNGVPAGFGNARMSILAIPLTPLEFVRWFFGVFGFSLRDGLIILLIPAMVDFPRSIGKLVANIIYIMKSGRFKSDRIYPSLTLLVPAHNEESKIERSINTLLEADYPFKDIIVIDDGSTDRTYQLALPFARRGEIKLVKREAASGAKGLALDYGLMFAKSEIIIVVDADTMLDYKSLREIVQPFRNEKVIAVSGNIKISNRDSLLAKFQAYEYTMSMEMGKRIQSLMHNILIIPGAFGAFRKEVVAGIGNYEVDTITEDFDLTMKALKIGWISFASNALAWTICPTEWKAWVRQRVRWSRGEVETLIKHRDMFFNRSYGVLGMLGAPDMLFMDVMLLFVRIAYILYIFIFYPLMHLGAGGGGAVWEFFSYFGRVTLMTLVVYLMIEVIMLVQSLALTPTKKDLKYFLYAPLIVLFYRPLYGIVRVRAHIEAMSGTEAQW